MSKCSNRKCGCYNNKYPFICTNNQDIPGCEDRKLVTSNTEDPNGYEDVVIITPEVNQISAYKEHLEFVNSTEPLSGIKKHTVIRIAQKFLDYIANIFIGRNIGTIGAEIYKGPTIVGSTTYQDFRKIAGSDSIIVDQIGDNIVPSVDEEWLQEQFDIPVVDYPVIDGNSMGTGTPIFLGLNAKKLDIATITTSNLSITENGDGGINIDTPESGSTTTAAYYVNKNYVPTVTTPSNGSIARPYRTLTEAVTRYIGTGTRLNPNPVESGKNTITLLSDIEDDISPTINGLTFRLEGNVKYKYTGSNPVTFDLVSLYNQVKTPGQPMSQGISMIIQGEGIITRSTGFMAIDIENDSTYPGATALDPMSALKIEEEGLGIRFLENENYSAYTPLTKKDGSPLYNGDIVRGANIPPTSAIINVTGKSLRYWSIEISGPMCTIQTMSQVGIRLNNGGAIYSHNINGLKVETVNNYISYETRLTDYVDGSITREVYYKPYAGRNNYEILNGSIIQIDSMAFTADGPDYTNVNSIIKITNNSDVNILNNIISGYDLGAISFIEYSGSSNFVGINNGNIPSRFSYFIKGDNTNPISITFQNSSINNILVSELYQASTTTIDTNSTVSTVRSKPLMSNPLYYETTAAAQADATLLKNSLYRSADNVIKLKV